MATDLRLRPLELDDELEVLRAHQAMAAEDFTFALGYEPAMAWRDYLGILENQRCGHDLEDGFVPATFLVAVVDGEIVGRVSIRHVLNDALRADGGHIGFGVLAEYRRRGHATTMVRQSLIIARSLGVDDTLVTCEDDNVASAAAIERCGGQLAAPGDTTTIRHYWIT